MTRETLDKANEIKADIDRIVNLEDLITNSAMEGAELRSYKNGTVLNSSKLWPEVTEKLMQVLRDEEVCLETQLAAL